MALRNAFGDLGLDSTLQAIRDRLPAALGGTGGVKVDVGSSALPTGAATSANQSTANTSLGNIDTSTAASKTDLDTLAGTVSASKVNVNISSGGITGSKSNNAGAPGSTNLGVLPSVANAAQQSWTEGNQVASSTDLKGNQRTRIQDAAGNDRGANVNASNQLSVSVDNTPTVTANQGGTWDIRNVSGTVSLPSGAATSANQSTANTSLSSIDSKTPALGQALAAASIPVILPSATVTTLTPPANPNPATSTKQSDGSQKSQVVDGSGNVVGTTGNALDVNIKSGGGSTSSNLAQVNGATVNVGTGTSGTGTQRVAVASDSSVILATGSNTIGSLTANQSVNTAQVAGTAVDTNSGAKSAGTQRIVLATDQPQLTNALKVDGSAVTQPVSGTVTANLGTLNGTATSANQTNANQKSQVVDGSGNVIGSTANALDVNVKSGGITGFSTSANQTNGTQQTQITDGTNIANNLKSDGTAAGQNAQMVAASYQSQTWSISSVTAGTTYDVGNYKSVSVQILTQYTGTTPTITWQASNDGVNWNALGLIISTGNTSLAASTTTTGIYNGPLNGRYFRLNFTGAYTSGSSTGTIVFSTQATVTHGWIGTTTITGNKTNNNAAPGATNTTVIPGLANAAQQSWTEGNAVMASMDLKGNQRMRISDAAGNDRGANVSSENALATAGPTASGSSLTASPVTKGGLAKTANPTAVSDGQVVNSTHDKLGKQVVVGSIRDLKVVQQTTITSSTAETTIGTAVASTFLDLYGLILTNTSASTTKVTIKDSTAGTTRASFEVPATETRGFMLNESASIPQATVNNNWTATCGTSVANLEVTALFVKNT